MKRMCSNGIKVTLVEKNRTAKWLAEQIGKDPTTISKWELTTFLFAHA